jgi:hypothetical protein
MFRALFVTEGVGFDWNAVFRVYWFVFCMVAFLAGFLIKFLYGLYRTPRAAIILGRTFAATSVALGLCDFPALAILATGWVALSLLPTGRGVEPTFTPIALAAICAGAALIRSRVERAIIRRLGATQCLSGGMPFLFVANFATLALALTALYWWAICSLPNRGKGI